MTFTEEQKKLLNQKITKANVKTRPGGGRKDLSYVEGWHVIQEANRIFGFDGWSSETIETFCVSDDPKCITYIARVQIKVGDIIREGTGAGHGRMGGLGDKYESAVKEAETDARKRALMTFGDQFGLSLYDKEENWKVEEETTSTNVTVSNKPIKMTEGEKFIKECEAFLRRNPAQESLEALRSNVSKRFESNAITAGQKNNLLQLILAQEDS